MIIVQKDLNGICVKLAAQDPEDIPKCLLFAQTKNIACKIFSFLRRFSLDRRYVSMYHASLTQRTKEFLRSEFSSSRSHLRCLVSTIAFGMVCLYA